MESIVFVLVIFAILYIIYWSIENDGVKELGEQKGLLRMRLPGVAKDSKKKAPNGPHDA